MIHKHWKTFSMPQSLSNKCKEVLLQVLGRGWTLTTSRRLIFKEGGVDIFNVYRSHGANDAKVMEALRQKLDEG